LLAKPLLTAGRFSDKMESQKSKLLAGFEISGKGQSGVEVYSHENVV